MLDCLREDPSLKREIRYFIDVISVIPEVFSGDSRIHIGESGLQTKNGIRFAIIDAIPTYGDLQRSATVVPLQEGVGFTWKSDLVLSCVSEWRRGGPDIR